MASTRPSTIAEYIEQAPEQGREKLAEIYKILKDAVPDAKECIKWGNPVFEENRILFAFAGFKSHLNFMPTGSSIEPFKEELSKYKTGKGTIQFPYDKSLPKTLIRKIALHRAKDVRENDTRWM